MVLTEGRADPQVVRAVWAIGLLQPESQSIAVSVGQVLLDAEIPPGGLDAGVAEGQLEQIQPGAALHGQFGERPSQASLGQWSTVLVSAAVSDGGTSHGIGGCCGRSRQTGR